jgi:cullin-associated NEDD8-dissociated protein 1
MTSVTMRACVDYRYMACSDVLNELSREGFDKFPSRETETAVLDAVTRAVFDASTDVASLGNQVRVADAEEGRWDVERAGV